MLLFETSIGPIALSAAGLAALWGGFELRDRARRMTAWPSVRGRVTGSTLVTDHTRMEDGTTAYYPQISYQYVVAGLEYRSQRRSLVDVGGSGLARGVAQRVLARYPVGSDVLVFYDPEHPSEAILERPDPVAGPVALFALGGALLIAGPLWMWWTTR
ncbi:MAG TPA: DUF3592 domain-containing protein [Gemmatimonadaceae bacterium]